MRPASPLNWLRLRRRCDIGLIPHREPGHGPGVHSTAGEGWREIKNGAVLIRASPFTVPNDDPLNPSHRRASATRSMWPKSPKPRRFSVASSLPSAQFSETSVSGGLPRVSHWPVRADDWRPQWAGPHQVLASITVPSPRFSGKQMEREAWRRRFFEANARAFLGDGLPWNWSIWKRHFPDFTPILDFIHVPSYLFRSRQGGSRRGRRCMEPVPRLDARCLGKETWRRCSRGTAGLANQARRFLRKGYAG